MQVYDLPNHEANKALLGMNSLLLLSFNGPRVMISTIDLPLHLGLTGLGFVEVPLPAFATLSRFKYQSGTQHEGLESKRSQFHPAPLHRFTPPQLLNRTEACLLERDVLSAIQACNTPQVICD